MRRIRAVKSQAKKEMDDRAMRAYLRGRSSHDDDKWSWGVVRASSRRRNSTFLAANTSLLGSSTMNGYQ
ncbi:unnamed protein product, partial [Amoebophrya sp. A25]|eukprot:GSA25T00025580001.1